MPAEMVLRQFCPPRESPHRLLPDKKLPYPFSERIARRLRGSLERERNEGKTTHRKQQGARLLDGGRRTRRKEGVGVGPGEILLRLLNKHITYQQLKGEPLPKARLTQLG